MDAHFLSLSKVWKPFENSVKPSLKSRWKTFVLEIC